MSYQKNNQRMRQVTHQNIVITPPDRALTIIVLFLVVIGFMFVFSASIPKAVNSGIWPFRFALNQLMGIILGYLGLRFFSKFNYKNLVNITNIFSIIVIALLIIVLKSGEVINGAQRWIMLGPLSLQPSELAKPAIVLLLARIFSKDTKLTDSSKYGTFALIAVMVALIFKQPNLSMVILLGLTGVAMYFVAGGSKKIIGMGFGGIGLAGLFGGLLQPFQLQRIKIWLCPESDPLGAGYNIIQSMVAFASGGLLGCGYGASKQKLAWLPEAHTDFIFAVVGEEIGYLGCLLIIGLFWAILQRGFVIAGKCPDMYGKLIAIGLTFSICAQAFINMGVSSSMLPATGVPLPFISYGGTSVMITLWMIGILLNISRKKVETIRVRQDV